MKNIRLLSIIAVSIALQGCGNPFGDKSFVDSISDGISSLFGRTTSNFVAGASQNFTTGNNYKGSIAVGGFVNQTSTVTSGGYKVMTSIKTSE